MRRIHLGLLLWLATCAGAHGGQPRRVKLKLVERLGVERRAEPVTTGIPIPRGELKSATAARLLGPDGKRVRAQFRAAGLWRPDESIRWLLVDFQADLGAGRSADYVLEYGEGVSPEARAGAGVVVRSDGLEACLKGLSREGCEACYILSYIDRNLIFGMSPRTVLHYAYRSLKELFR